MLENVFIGQKVLQCLKMFLQNRRFNKHILNRRFHNAQNVFVVQKVQGYIRISFG